MASAGLPFESTKQPQSLSLFVTYISMSGTGTKGARFSFSSRFKDLNSTNILFNFFPFFFFSIFFFRTGRDFSFFNYYDDFNCYHCLGALCS